MFTRLKGQAHSTFNMSTSLFLTCSEAALSITPLISGGMFSFITFCSPPYIVETGLKYVLSGRHSSVTNIGLPLLCLHHVCGVVMKGFNTLFEVSLTGVN